MAKYFRELMTDLALDLGLRERFYNDFTSVVGDYELTEDELDALRAFDFRIDAYVSQENPAPHLLETSEKTHAYVSVRIIVRPSIRSITRFLIMDNTNSDYHAFGPSINKLSNPKPELQDSFAKGMANAGTGKAEKLLELAPLIEDNINYEDTALPPSASRPDRISDINIVGLGIAGVDHITRETEHILRSSNEILYVGHGLGLHAYLSHLCPSVINLGEGTYSDGTDRVDAYRKMAARVIDAALTKKPVTFALYGHPLIFAYPPFLLRRMAALTGLSISVRPGVSSIDTLFSDLWVDPAVSGMLIYEASDVLIAKRPFLPTVDAIVLQIGALETALYSTATSKPERFDRFISHLLQFYPADHTVFAVSSAAYGMLAPDIVEFQLGKMRDHASRLTSGYTLYIPAKEQPADVDLEIVANMSSTAHLASITEPPNAG